MTDRAASIRKALDAKRAQAVERLAGLEASFADIVESARDSNLDDEHDTEGVTIAVSRAQVSSLADESRRQLVEIDRALARLDEGAYGGCQRCGGQIPLERLVARPLAITCIECARAGSTR